MTEPTASRTVIVRQPKGMHLRPADLLVRTAGQFESDIRIVHRGEQFDAKSMLSVMTLAAEQGTELEIRASGADAEQALDAIEDLFQRGFDEMTDEPNSVQDQSAEN